METHPGIFMFNLIFLILFSQSKNRAFRVAAVLVNTCHFTSSITNLSASKIGISSCIPVWPLGTCDQICSSRLSWKIFILWDPFLNSSKQVFTSAVTFFWRSLPADWAHIHTYRPCLSPRHYISRAAYVHHGEFTKYLSHQQMRWCQRNGITGRREKKNEANN